jgi:environmental stress-induced protein Ves
MMIVRLADRPIAAWKNGAGQTRELLSEPLPTNDGFTWRVSVATIVSSGQFSCFPGVDRSFVKLGDGSLQLDVGGRLLHAEAGQILTFPGEAPVEAIVAQGPVWALNVMSYRSATSHQVTIGRQEAPPPEHMRMRCMVALVRLGLGDLQLEPGDLLDGIDMAALPQSPDSAAIYLSSDRRGIARKRSLI